MAGFDHSVFWPAFEAAGMLHAASTVLPGQTSPTSFKVGYRRPDVNPITGAQSADYEIEYQYADAPTLAEGAEVIVDVSTDGTPRNVLFRVRSEPEVDTSRGADGHWRCAYLTRIGDCAN